MAESPAILVIGPRWVGDMVMAQCLLAALKQLHPQASIDVVAPAWAAPLLARMPQVRQRIEATTRPGSLGLAERWRFGRSLRGRYEAAYVMPGSWKSAQIPFFAGIPHRVGHLREIR
jgi:heptosyltransferase-2